MPEQRRASAGPGPVLATLAGAAGGGANTFSGYPFDSVKVRLQASPRGTFAGPLDCCRHILKTEGVRGLYRGLSVPLIGGVVETGINYAAYTQSLKWFEGSAAVPQTSSLGSIAASAAIAGLVLSSVLSPAELVKCRLQMGSNSVHGAPGYKGPVDCIQLLLRTEGLRGLGRGMTGTLARESIGNSFFFTLYETLRRQIPGRPAQASGQQQQMGLVAILQDSAGAIMCGGLAGMGMWAFVLPIDVAKSRLQVARPGTTYDVSLLQNLKLLYQERCHVVYARYQRKHAVAEAASHLQRRLIYEWVLRSGMAGS